MVTYRWSRAMMRSVVGAIGTLVAGKTCGLSQDVKSSVTPVPRAICAVWGDAAMAKVEMEAK
jgi:hypothetical protein